MASRPLPNNGAHSSPVRQNVALRWLNNAAPAPAALKTVRSPVKKWPPPARVEAPPHSPVAAAPVPTPVIEKKVAASAFQTARAMFEAKKAPAAAASPPPSRRRVAFPTPVVAKQDSNSSDLSSSSCSTVDSETNHKLEECVETQKPKPSLPVQALEKMEKETVRVSTPVHDSAKISPNTAKPLVSLQPQEARASQPPSPAAIGINTEKMKQAQPMEADIDPFRLLLPVDTPPTLPDEVPSVYDSAAVEMEKNIKKVVRKLDTLIKDFGRIRALQLVPCLLSVQPDILKGNALLLTAKNYSLRNEEALRQELRELQVASVMNTQVTTKAPSSRAPTSPSKAKRVASPNSAPARRVCSASEAQPANATVEYISSPIAQSRTSAVPPPSTDISSQKKPTLINSVQCLAATKTTATKPVEPMPEPQEVAPPVINVAVAGPIQQVLAPSLVAMKRAESATSEEEFRVENLFGEIIKTPSPKEQPHKQSGTDALVAPVSPTSSIQSFEEAENLFGERLSSSSPSSVSRRKTVTWGETQTVEVPIQRDAQVKTTKKPLPFLFGPATAAAFDSDSDESDFSD